MNPFYGLALIAVYFSILLAVSWFTARKESGTDAFFTANRNSKWYLVAFGMIGTSLSGVTFISVPGMVKSAQFYYLQMVFGYLIGYFVIANLLLPMYYRLNLVSIYTYLETRFGYWSYKTGAGFFLLSRILGSSARFFLVLSVLHLSIFEPFHIPFWLTVGIGLLLIWVYTYKGGMKTIIITDTLQTVCMLAGVLASIFFLADYLNLSFARIPSFVRQNPLSELINTEISSKYFWLKQVLAGAFIAITMTGLDQDMMQKNLTCRSIGEARKNMYWFSFILLIVNVLFLVLGLFLYAYAGAADIALPEKSDKLFPLLALHHFPVWLGIMFLMGIIAATYASTDSALTALTTSFCFDFLNFSRLDEGLRKKLKLKVHLAMSAMVWIVVLFFNAFNRESLIVTVFDLAGYTYGPLLGLYAMGLLSRIRPADAWVPWLSVLSMVLSFLLKTNSRTLFGGYEIGFEILIINGLITFIALWFSSFFRAAAPKSGMP
jgi:Na+/proline symporter